MNPGESEEKPNATTKWMPTKCLSWICFSQLCIVGTISLLKIRDEDPNQLQWYNWTKFWQMVNGFKVDHNKCMNFSKIFLGRGDGSPGGEEIETNA